MAFPGMTTFTSGALNLADSVMAFGRKEAETIVVTLTDGVPISPGDLRTASRKLKKEARLVSVPVLGMGMGISDLTSLKALASRNQDDNAVVIEDPHELEFIPAV